MPTTGDIIINWGTSDNTNTVDWVPGGTAAITNGTVITRNITLQPRQRPPAVALPANSEPVLRPQAPKRGRTSARDWFRIENAAGEAADIYIYDEITDPFMAEFWGGISASGFVKELQALKGKALNVHLNSPGGSVFEGLAIYNSLRQHDAPVNVIVDGIAASIASVIAMAGDSVTMAPHSMMMIHEPWALTVGNMADHEQQVKVLDAIGRDIAGVYAERAGGKNDWRAKMREETWLTDEDAVRMGLADRIDTQASPAQNSFDLSRFRNVPADLAAGPAQPEGSADPTPTKRAAEQALRDVGFSARTAKAILSEGFSVIEDWDDPESAEDPVLGMRAPDVVTDDADDATGMAAIIPLDLARARLLLATSR